MDLCQGKATFFTEHAVHRYMSIYTGLLSCFTDHTAAADGLLIYYCYWYITTTVADILLLPPTPPPPLLSYYYCYHHWPTTTATTTDLLLLLPPLTYYYCYHHWPTTTAITSDLLLLLLLCNSSPSSSVQKCFRLLFYSVVDSSKVCLRDCIFLLVKVKVILEQAMKVKRGLEL
jgi:hypothetical protein